MSGSARQSRRRPAAPTLDLGFEDDAPFEHDPLDPHPEHPTPLDLVMRLTLSERETRVRALIRLSQNKFDQAIDQHVKGREIVGFCSLVSGGNDSYTAANIFRDVATHHAHANTETGIEATREFVRATAAAWGKPLLEHSPQPGKGYFDFVRGNVWARHRVTGLLVKTWPGGFPGPAMHKIMYQRLKERALDNVPRDLGISGSAHHRVVFIAGRRRPESKVRWTIPYADRRGTILWVSPLAVWHKADLRAYRQLVPGVPVNPVAQTLGMSGECGCLSYAKEGEPERWRAEFPNDPFIQKVNEVEAEIADRTDIPYELKRWGWASYYDDPDAVIKRLKLASAAVELEADMSRTLCSTNCGPDPLFDAMDPLFDLEQFSEGATP